MNYRQLRSVIKTWPPIHLLLFHTGESQGVKAYDDLTWKWEQKTPHLLLFHTGESQGVKAYDDPDMKMWTTNSSPAARDWDHPAAGRTRCCPPPAQTPVAWQSGRCKGRVQSWLLAGATEQSRYSGNGNPVNMPDPIQKRFGYGQLWPTCGHNRARSNILHPIPFRFLKRRHGWYCTKSTRVRSGWPCQSLAKGIWSGSKLVCKNQGTSFWQSWCNQPATTFPLYDSVAIIHRRPRSYCAKPAWIGSGMFTGKDQGGLQYSSTLYAVESN